MLPQNDEFNFATKRATTVQENFCCDEIQLMDVLNQEQRKSNISVTTKRLSINIGTLSVQELFFQLIGLLGVRLGVSSVGMVELHMRFVHGASLAT